MTDWDVFREACLALLRGQNPYSVGQGQMLFFNPVWTLVPLIPLAVLPPITGLLLNASASFTSLLLISRRLRLKSIDYFWIAICPMHLQSCIYGNIEWLPLLGLLFPPPVAMIFFAMKPQATIGLIVLLMLEEWRKGGLKALVLTLLPTFILAALSVLLYGLPPVPNPDNPGLRSLFPYSLIIGIPVFLLALKQRDRQKAMFVGPFVAPYVTFHGYLPALFAFRGKYLAFAVLISFVPVILGIVA